MKKRNNLKRRATNFTKQLAYMVMWGEDPPKGKKKVKGKDKR